MEFLNLIREGKHAAIIRYVKECKCLASYQELALVERGEHEEIMSYIAYHYFEPESFKTFLDRGKLNEVRFYLACDQIVYDDAALLELGSGVLNEYADYLVRHHDTYVETSCDGYANRLEYAQCLLIKSGNHCVIRRYIAKACLQPKALSLLRKKGQPEDNLVYDLKWKIK